MSMFQSTAGCGDIHTLFLPPGARGQPPPDRRFASTLPDVRGQPPPASGFAATANNVNATTFKGGPLNVSF